MSDAVYIGLGSNQGDRARSLFAALEAIRHIDAVAVLGCSSLYDSAPVGPAQPRFLNAVVRLACDLEPRRLLGVLQEIERELGRTRVARWGPRTIDLDILLWGERVVADPDLQVPHLELHRRRFALEPLVELDPHARHPLLGLTAQALLGAVVGQDVVRLPALDWSDAFGLDAVR